MTDHPFETAGQNPPLVHLENALGARGRSADSQIAAAEFEAALIGLRVAYHQALCHRFGYPVPSVERLEAIVRQERDESLVLAQIINGAQVGRANVGAGSVTGESAHEIAEASDAGSPFNSLSFLKRIWCIFDRLGGRH